ncbi:MAG: ribose-phosphate diphosphokinase [Burkholderiales bacterium]
MQGTDGFTILAGSSNPALAAAIARKLNVGLGECVIDRFPDGEVSVRLMETVCRKSVFLVQSTSPPVNEHLVELLVLTDACRRSAAACITAVVPYFGYGRADKRHGRREPITARVVADLLQTVGIAHVVTMDLHTPQIEGFFHAPVDTLTAVTILCDALRGRLPSDAVVVSPDRGRVSLATHYAQCLGAAVVVMHKRRDDATHTELAHVVGDVVGKACLVVDDMISTGGTIANSVNALLARGARPEIFVAATHGLLLPGARAKLDTPAVREVFVTDTVDVPEKDWRKLHVVSIAAPITAALERFLAYGAACRDA